MLLAFDFDGTLLLNDRLPDHIYDTFRALQAKGYTIAIITGRWAIPVEYQPDLPFDICATNNGGQVADKYGVHYALEFDRHEVEYILKHGPLDAHIVAFSKDTIYSNQPENMRARTWTAPYTIQPLMHAPLQGLLKLNIVHNQAPDIRAHISRQLPDITVTGGQEPYLTYLTFTPKQANKGYALRAIAQHIDIPITECIVFGDSDNDIEMFKVAGKAVQIGDLDILSPHAHIQLSNPQELIQWLKDHLLDQHNSLIEPST